MQKQQYQKYTMSYDDSMKLCVGEFEAHEAYPYEDYLLEHYTGKREKALDFACGMGRMMNRMLTSFEQVDGVDINSKNIEYARRYLIEKGHDTNSFNLYKSEGTGVTINGKEEYYDFIYSTIALQHIAVHKIRTEIFKDLFSLLKRGGKCCHQMGFAWDNGVHWFDNHYTARSTNAGLDVCIPDDTYFPLITQDFEDIGYRNVTYEMKISPHPGKGSDHHPIWLFIHMER